MRALFFQTVKHNNDKQSKTKLLVQTVATPKETLNTASNAAGATAPQMAAAEALHGRNQQVCFVFKNKHKNKNINKTTTSNKTTINRVFVEEHKQL